VGATEASRPWPGLDLTTPVVSLCAPTAQEMFEDLIEEMEEEYEKAKVRRPAWAGCGVPIRPTALQPPS
jgi:hypothetical protein